MMFSALEEMEIIKEASHIDHAESYDDIYYKSDLADLLYKYAQTKGKLPKSWIKRGRATLQYVIRILKRNPEETLVFFRKNGDIENWAEVFIEFEENQLKLTISDKFQLLTFIKDDPTAKSIEDICRNTNLGEEAYKMCKENNKNYSDTWNNNEKASLKWCSRFLKDCSENTLASLQEKFKSKFPNFIYEVKESRELDTEKSSTSSIRPSEAPQSEQDTIDPTVPESQKQSSDKKFEFTDKETLLKSLEQNVEVQSFEDICKKTNVREIAFKLTGTKQKPKSWKGKLPLNLQIDILKQCSTKYPKLFKSKFPNVILSTEASGSDLNPFLDCLVSEALERYKSSVESQIDTEELRTSSIKEVDKPQPEIQYIKETENLENKAARFSETPLPELQIEREKEKGIVPSLKSQVTEDSRSAIEEFYEHEQNPNILDKSFEEFEEENKELEKGIIKKKVKCDLEDLLDD